MTRTGTLPLRVCVAVHGYEPVGWAADTARLVSTFVTPAVRVLAVLDVPCPPFTSLTGAARRAYRTARTEWRHDEDVRLQDAIDALVGGLPGDIEVVRAPCRSRGHALTIAAEAAAWRTDVLVVGPPATRLTSWLWPGAVHERVLRRAGCTVVITTPPGFVARRRRLVALSRPAAVGRGA